MSAIKGLLNLTSQHLQDLQNKHPGVGSDFLAIPKYGASHVMLCQRIYMAQTNQDVTQVNKTASWADIVGANVPNHKATSFKRQTL